MLHQKHKSYKFVLPLKNWVDWITTRQEEKCHNLKNVYFEKKCLKIFLKKHIFPLMTIFYGFTRKTETSWAKKIAKFILES